MSAADCRGEDCCLATLKKVGLSNPKVITHEEVKTVEEAARELSQFGEPCVGVKNLFLKGKKGELVLVSALPETRTDMKAVQQVMGTSDLRFAPAELLLSTLGVVQGSVTPLALVNDPEKTVIVCLDQALLNSTLPLVLHPCRNDKSLLLTAAQLRDYVAATGHTMKVVDFAAIPDKKPAPAKKAPAPAAEANKKKAAVDVKGETKLGVNVKKEGNFSGWYQQVITKAEMIDYYDVSGCYIIRPWANSIWDSIRRFMEDTMSEMGVENCYFPMFVSKAVLEVEKDHLEGFAPEVAWVTKAGDTDLEVPMAIRPTSETVMYPYYAKWIRSHRDLPLRLNQWNNVIRWEFSHPTPFIRTREFLWQEGHCAHATYEGCQEEVLEVLDLYASVYEDLLAVPVVKGQKTEKEKFAGAFLTTTVETYIDAVGRGCQGGTSHNLGQNFGKMFNIEYEDPVKNDGSKLIPWQNSWGFTTRSIGVMVMVHGDNIGVVLPPRVAPVQVVIIPVGITKDTTEEGRKVLYAGAEALQKELRAAGIRAKTDLRDNYSPGWRFNHWEVKGVPIRVELGPKELEQKSLAVSIRYNGEKQTIPWNEQVTKSVQEQLDTIQSGMLQRARQMREERTKQLTAWEAFTPALQDRCLVLAPWCGSQACEDAVKTDSAEESKQLSAGVPEDERAPSMGAKTLCIPFQQPGPIEGHKCVCKSCDKAATQWVLFGRSY